MPQGKNKDFKLPQIPSAGYGIAIFLLLLFISWTYFFHIPQIDSRVFRLTYPMLDPGSSLLQKKDLLVNFQPLRASLRAQYESHPDFITGIYFEYLPTGANVAINRNTEIFPASLLKLPVAMAVMKKIEEGKWNPKNELVLLPGDKDPGFGTLYEKEFGTRFTIEELLRQALVESDNTAHRILLRNVDDQELLDIYDHLGFEDIREKRTDKLSARRFSVFFRSLFVASFLTPEYSQKLLDLLSINLFPDYISSGFPPEVKFANKIGINVERGVYADAGIVYVPDRPYILTILLESRGSRGTEEKAKKLMQEISGKIYGFVRDAIASR